MKSESLKINDPVLELKLAFESELVRSESMIVLQEFEKIDAFDLDCYSFDDSESSDE